MFSIDEAILEEFEGLHTPEEFRDVCTVEEMIDGQMEKYSRDYHHLFHALGLSTQKEVQDVIQKIAQYQQLQR